MGRRLIVAAMCCGLGWAQAATPPVAERCHGMLEDSLAAKNPDTRKEAVTALSLDVVSEKLISRLATMLEDKDVPVRVATVGSLADLKSTRTVKILDGALQDEVPEVAFAAAKALFDLHAPAGEAALLSVLTKEEKTSSGFIRSQMRDGMRMLHTPRELFIMGLKQGIGFVPLPGFGAGVSSLRGILADSGVSGRATAALLLGRDRDAKVEQALRDALWDNEWQVRAAAIHSLALQNNAAVQGDFVRLLDDSKLPVRLRAASGWLRLDAVRRTGERRKAAVGRKH